MLLPSKLGLETARFFRPKKIGFVNANVQVVRIVGGLRWGWEDRSTDSPLPAFCWGAVVFLCASQPVSRYFAGIFSFQMPTSKMLSLLSLDLFCFQNAHFLFSPVELVMFGGVQTPPKNRRMPKAARVFKLSLSHRNASENKKDRSKGCAVWWIQGKTCTMFASFQT